jgi:hypothetical protein
VSVYVSKCAKDRYACFISDGDQSKWRHAVDYAVVCGHAACSLQMV